MEHFIYILDGVVKMQYLCVCVCVRERALHYLGIAITSSKTFKQYYASDFYIATNFNFPLSLAMQYQCEWCTKFLPLIKYILNKYRFF